MKPPQIQFLGRIPFDEALALQEENVNRLYQMRTAGKPEAGVLFLLEHDPVYTIGRTRDQSSLSPADPNVTVASTQGSNTASVTAGVRLPHPVRETNRGGRATYHGPGQLVGYPVLDLSVFIPDLHAYLRFLEDFLLTLLAEFGVRGERRKEFTGAWVQGKKIASIGVGVRHWISMHGFALNVEPASLAGFNAITPCGIANVQMTCLAAEAGRAVTLQETIETAAKLFPSFYESNRKVTV
jgi:lipoyl(octanoyl) transferase